MVITLEMKVILTIIILTCIKTSFSQSTGTLNVSTSDIQGKWYLDKVSFLENKNFDKCDKLVVETIIAKTNTDTTFTPTYVKFKHNKFRLDKYPYRARRNSYKTTFYLQQYTTSGDCGNQAHSLTNELCSEKLCLTKELNGTVYFHNTDKFIVVTNDKKTAYLFARQK